MIGNMERAGRTGEPAGPPVPLAVTNAIYFATRKRVHSTPFKNHDLSGSRMVKA